MKKLFICFILSIVLFGNALSQSSTHFFVGLQPSVTVEPFYNKGEFDVDIFPFIFEMTLGSRIDFRLCPTTNYHFGGTYNGFSDIGVFTVWPIFFKKNKEEDTKPYGFYIGPVVGFGRNFINEHYTTTLALEPGYIFETKNRFTITLGLQYGASYFMYDSQENKWTTHFGPKITFGFWLK